MDVWQELDAFLEKHAYDYSISFGLEYSSVIDWVADLTPRRNHPQARAYGLWQAQSTVREDAIRQALEAARKALEGDPRDE